MHSGNVGNQFRWTPNAGNAVSWPILYGNAFNWLLLAAKFANLVSWPVHFSSAGLCWRKAMPSSHWANIRDSTKRHWFQLQDA